MNKDIKRYYDKHHNIDKKLMDRIDWEATEKGLRTKYTLSYQKSLHNFRNTMSINKKWGRVASDVCPLCTSEPETLMHLMQCKHEDIVLVRGNLITRFSDKLSKLNTSPDITNIGIKYFSNMWTVASLQNLQ